MPAPNADDPCRLCAAGIRRFRLRLHSQVQRHANGRMVRLDRWYHDCTRCGRAAVICTVCHWPLGQDAPTPTPPQDLHDWPTDVFAAVVGAPEEVPMQEQSVPDPWSTSLAGVLTVAPMKTGLRDPEFRFGELSDEERAEVVADRALTGESAAYLLNALRAWDPDATDATAGSQP